MSKREKFLVFFALFCLFCFRLDLAASSQSAPTAQDGDGLRLSTPEEIKSEFNSVPCKNEERQSAVKSLFERMGADPADITIDKYKKVENVVIRKASSSPESGNEKIVIGAHYDKTAMGCGAVDNWTGIVALAHIYRTLKNVPLNKTVLFIAFGEEEKGLVGSAAMVEPIKKEEAADYCAMINMDSFGLDDLQVIDDISSKKLVKLVENLAKEENVPFKRVYFSGGSSDSDSFLKKNIPAITLHGLSSNWKNILHTGFDKPTMIKPEGVYQGYRLALALLVDIDKSSCREFRKK
ncbi:MAG: M20/M25/M40 family metallo-hydrolase [Blastocatellia bacterium]|nr:M20/M25/M40 family metallo-hydrolase [Blastocatellia bacterium]